MPKLMCPCGYVRDLSPIPDEGWVTFHDADYEKVVDAEILINSISGGTSLPGNDHPRVAEYDQAMRVIVNAKGLLLECPECGRIMWEKEGEKDFRIFMEEKK